MVKKKESYDAPKLVVNMVNDEGNEIVENKKSKMSIKKSRQSRNSVLAPDLNALAIPNKLPEGMNDTKYKEARNKGKDAKQVALENWQGALNGMKRPSVMMKTGISRRMSQQMNLSQIPGTAEYEARMEENRKRDNALRLQTQIEKDDKIDWVEKRRKANDLKHGALLMVGVLVTYMANEDIITTFKIFPPAVHTARMINTAFCIPFIYFVVIHYKAVLEVMKLKKQIYHKTTLMQSPLKKAVIIECIFNCIHQPPGPEIILDLKAVNYDYQMAVDYYFIILMFFRLYIWVRIYFNYSIWTSIRAQRVCLMNGFEVDSGFGLKAMMNAEPVNMMVIACLLTILFFGLIVREFEKKMLYPGRTYNYDYMINSYWCIVLTMTTVGYGEVFPVTLFGRQFTILASIIGNTVMSQVIVTLTNLIELSSEETEAFNTLCAGLDVRLKFKDEAIEFIQTWARYMYVFNRPMPIKVKLKYRIELLLMKNRFKYKRLSIMHSDLDVDESIDTLNGSQDSFFEQNQYKISIFKRNVTKKCGNLRDTQCKIETMCIRTYNTVQRLCSFMKIADKLVGVNDLTEVDELIGVKIDYGKKVMQKEVKGNTVKTSDYWQKQMMTSKKDLLAFYESIADKTIFKGMETNKALALMNK